MRAFFCFCTFTGKACVGVLFAWGTLSRADCRDLDRERPDSNGCHQLDPTPLCRIRQPSLQSPLQSPSPAMPWPLKCPLNTLVDATPPLSGPEMLGLASLNSAVPFSEPRLQGPQLRHERALNRECIVLFTLPGRSQQPSDPVPHSPQALETHQKNPSCSELC